MIIWLCKYCCFLTNYYLYRRNPRVLYSRSILISIPMTGYVSCMLRKQVSSPQRGKETCFRNMHEKRMLWRWGGGEGFSWTASAPMMNIKRKCCGGGGGGGFSWTASAPMINISVLLALLRL